MKQTKKNKTSFRNPTIKKNTKFALEHRKQRPKNQYLKIITAFYSTIILRKIHLLTLYLTIITAFYHNIEKKTLQITQYVKITLTFTIILTKTQQITNKTIKNCVI